MWLVVQTLSFPQAKTLESWIYKVAEVPNSVQDPAGGRKTALWYHNTAPVGSDEQLVQPRIRYQTSHIITGAERAIAILTPQNVSSLL